MAPTRWQSFTSCPQEASLAEDEDVSDRINSDLDIQWRHAPKTQITERKTGTCRCPDRGGRYEARSKFWSSKNSRANHHGAPLDPDGSDLGSVALHAIAATRVCVEHHRAKAWLTSHRLTPPRLVVPVGQIWPPHQARTTTMKSPAPPQHPRKQPAPARRHATEIGRAHV